MEALKSNRRSRARAQSGFSMVELLIATVVLSVGLLALAGFMAKMDLTTHESRFTSTAAMLCSEKLEQLSGYTPDAPEVKIVGGHAVGSLTDDTSQNVDTDEGSKLVSYYDVVTISAVDGSIRETTVDAKGEYQTIVQKPDGIDPEPEAGPADEEHAVKFTRRWLIEDNVPGLPSEVRRITVRVEYPSVGKTAKFQMSMVRNAEPDEE